MTDLFRRFRGYETTVAAIARYMQGHGLTPAEVLAAYDAWLAERMAEMEPAKRVASGKLLRVSSSATRNPQPATRKKRHKAGDFAQLPHACPRCGGTAELYQMCPIESPVWRTQLACMTDGCSWHGKSRLPIEALEAAGAKNIKHNVTEG